MDERIEKIIIEIENNLSKPLNTDYLAQSFGVSTSHLQYLFKRETGTNITNFVKNLRFQTARELLETTDLSVKEIRNKVTSTNTSHFFRQFKKEFGQSPGEYRRNFKKS